MPLVDMYDLAGDDDDRRISPFCWRIRMSLAHKGIDVRTIPWRLSERDAISPYGATSVPVVIDRGKAIRDSWRIAIYLDEAFPDRPLFESPQARAYALWLHHWTVRSLHPVVVPLILKDVLAHLHPRDIDYFRTTRERAFGKPLEQVMDQSPEALRRLHATLSPLRRTLKEQPFVAGAAPALADYALFSVFQWARSCSPQPLVPLDDPLQPWLGRMLDLYGGLARRAKGYDTFLAPASASASAKEK